MADFVDKDKLFCNDYNALFLLEYPTALKLLRRLIEIADECVGDRRYRRDFTYEGVCDMFAKTIVDYSKMAYVKDMQGTDAIKAFKTNLSQREPFDKWSDFEMGMAEYANTLSSESELIECVRDFKTHMVNHLKNENQKMIEVIKEGRPKIILDELGRSFNQFYDGFTGC